MATVIRHDIKEVSFGVYNEEEVLKLSVVRITSSATYDRLGNSLQGGLYDPAMGPVDSRSVCITCGLSMRDCPGHMGHLPLSLPLYNPLTFATVFQILRVKCFGCHGFRLGSFACRVVALKLTLIDIGLIDESEGLDQTLANAENKQGLVMSIEERIRDLPAIGWASGEVKARRRAIIKAFLQDVIGCATCDRCNVHKSQVRKDGYIKFFLKSKGFGARPKSALAEVRSKGEGENDSEQEEEDDSEDDQEEEETKGGGNDDEESKGTESFRKRRKKGGKDGKDGDKYMAPVEVQMHLKLLWQTEAKLATLIWGRAAALERQESPRRAGQGNPDGWKTFFWRVLPIAPSRFRPPSRSDDGSLAEHPQNHNIIKIMSLDERIRNLLRDEAYKEAGEDQDQSTDMASLDPQAFSRVLSTWIDLQNMVNAYIDSSKEANARLAGSNVTPGIRQGLEKKEGLFRMHMMGKRVNFACRSVISPDPYIGTSEIGLPVRFAKTLTYPEPVTPFNVVVLRQLVENGPDIHPGANFIEDAKGRLSVLRRFDANRRKALAARLLTPPGQKVLRHLHDGDVVLMNRQPTLHKPGIMAHHARVLKSQTQQTIRMHYANCNTYNADFDGDEMNCHFPQDELSRAEAETIACTDEQYIAPTNGKPLRGLIQDHVGSGVKMTSKDCFLDREDFQHVLYCTLSGLPGVEIVRPQGHIEMPAPTIWKPVPLWTGKQMVSSVLRHLTAGLPPLNLDFKAKTPGSAFGADQDEHLVIFRGGDLVQGVLDKAAFGASEGGLVHGVYEFYGPPFAGRLLTALGRLFTVYLQFAGHTCGIEDLVLTAEADKKRRALIDRAGRLGRLAMECFTSGKPFEPPTHGEEVDPLPPQALLKLRDKTAAMLEEDYRSGGVTQGAAIDNFMRTVLSPVSSDIIKACLPDGLEKPFPHNAFSLMVATGAKGSTVNQSQISCGLGQQELEGRRVPLMPSGKSLPSFLPYDPSPRAGGFIVDRFLTGVRPQEYYFHCMAGREGLIDTAVKTSRSGYLQRCLVKGLEELRVHYDYTVRDADAGIVQFLYGEDGIDTLNSKYLDGKPPEMTALARNYAALLYKYKIDGGFLQRTGMDMSTARRMHQQIVEARKQRESRQELGVGSIVQVKKLKRGRDEWMMGSWVEGWVLAEVIKVRGSKKADRGPTYDIRYEDGKVMKRVPRHVAHVVTEPLPGLKAVSAPLVEIIRPFILPDPVMGRAILGLHLGIVSERFQDAIQDYLDDDPDGFIASSGKGKGGKLGLELLLWLKYLRSLSAPGEAVGSIAAQSIGEPSTQMTLNTFHLAGHGGANVTLGIPRLREIIMTASQKIKTPSMTVKLQPSVSRIEAQRLASYLRRVQLSELIDHKKGVTVIEKLAKGTGPWQRSYQIQMQLYDEDVLEEAFGLDYDKLFDVLYGKYVTLLVSLVTQELKKVSSKETLFIVSKRLRGGRGGAGGGGSLEEADEDEANLEAPSTKKKQGRTIEVEEDDEDEEEENEDADEAQGTLSFGRKEEKGEYEADEEDPSSKMDFDGEGGQEEGRGKTKRKKQKSAATDEEEDDDEEKEEGEEEGEVFTQQAKDKTASKRKGDDDDDVKLRPSRAIDHPFYDDMEMDKSIGIFTIKLKTQASFRRLLMVQIAEDAASRLTIRAAKGINQAFVVEDRAGGPASIQTEGCNLEELWSMANTVIDHSSILSNDIWAIHQTYGCEASRATIVKEIQGVFRAYGIVVDPRHLGLVADFMTYQGGFRALNRIGMAQVSSPFLQMSFETTATFLTEAALSGEIDNLTTPSAKLVMGQPAGNGSGCMSLMVPINKGGEF